MSTRESLLQQALLSQSPGAWDARWSFHEPWDSGFQRMFFMQTAPFFRSTSIFLMPHREYKRWWINELGLPPIRACPESRPKRKRCSDSAPGNKLWEKSRVIAEWSQVSGLGILTIRTEQTSSNHDLAHEQGISSQAFPLTLRPSHKGTQEKSDGVKSVQNPLAF